jgi:uncharacterized protein YxjI
MYNKLEESAPHKLKKKLFHWKVTLSRQVVPNEHRAVCLIANMPATKKMRGMLISLILVGLTIS